MEVLEAGQRVFRFADRHGKNVKDLISRSDFGSSLADMNIMSYEVTMMTTYWQLAANLSKDLTEPLKSIVNK